MKTDLDAAILDRVVDGYELGKLPTNPCAGPYLNYIWPLNRRNGRLVQLDGSQALVWFNEHPRALMVEVRLAQPWFPGHNWPGPCSVWTRKRVAARPDEVVDQARQCIAAVSTLARLRASAVSECDGTTRLFSRGKKRPKFEGWMSQHLIATAVSGPVLTPRRARKSTDVVEDAIRRYMTAQGVVAYRKYPSSARRAIRLSGWLTAEIIASQAGVTHRRDKPRAFTA